MNTSLTPNHNLRAATLAVGAIAALLILISATRPEKAPAAPEPVPVAAARSPAADAQRDREFRAVVYAKALRESAKDPESVSFKNVTLGSDGAVCIVYRARNSFNAMLQSEAVVLVDKAGQPLLLQRDRDGNAYVHAFNKHCRSPIQDVTALVQYAAK